MKTFTLNPSVASTIIPLQNKRLVMPTVLVGDLVHRLVETHLALVGKVAANLVYWSFGAPCVRATACVDNKSLLHHVRFDDNPFVNRLLISDAITWLLLGNISAKHHSSIHFSTGRVSIEVHIARVPRVAVTSFQVITQVYIFTIAERQRINHKIYNSYN